MSDPIDDLPLCDWCKKRPGVVKWQGFRYCGVCAQTLVGNKAMKVLERMVERG